MQGMKRVSVTTLILFHLGMTVACRNGSANEWTDFLERPDAGTAQAVVATHDASECGWGKGANQRVFPLEFHQPLFQLITNGDKHAFLVGLSMVSCLDGGELEDFYQSGSQFLEHDPSNFLLLATQFKLDARRVGTMAAGVAAVDDEEAALEVLAKRRELLSGVADESVALARSEAIRAIDEREHRLKQRSQSEGSAK